MGWIEMTLRALSNRVEYLFRLISTLQDALTNLRQQAYAAQQPAGGGSSGSSVPYACVLSANIAAASGQPASGTPTSLTEQTVYALSGGAWSSVSTSATVYNGLQTEALSGYTTYLLKNADGTYLAITQDCTS